MSVLLTPNMTAPGIHNDLYMRSLTWILRERAGGGGWPPHDANKVSGWTLIRLIAAVHEKPPRAVALDLIELHELSQNDGQWP